jgi:hypothetical protein
MSSRSCARTCRKTSRRQSVARARASRVVARQLVQKVAELHAASATVRSFRSRRRRPAAWWCARRHRAACGSRRRRNVAARSAHRGRGRVTGPAGTLRAQNRRRSSQNDLRSAPRARAPAARARRRRPEAIASVLGRTRPRVPRRALPSNELGRRRRRCRRADVAQRVAGTVWIGDRELEKRGRRDPEGQQVRASHDALGCSHSIPRAGRRCAAAPALTRARRVASTAYAWRAGSPGHPLRAPDPLAFSEMSRGQAGALAQRRGGPRARAYAVAAQFAPVLGGGSRIS